MKSFICAVVGESFNNPDGEPRQTIIKHHVQPGMYAQLEPEPENPHDENAVAVYVASFQIGYLKRDVAERILPHLEEFNVDATVHAINGGKDGQLYGVTLTIQIQGEEGDEDDDDEIYDEPVYQPRDPASKARQTRYELSYSHKDDLETMVDCCIGEELEFWNTPNGQRRIPRPIFFQRVAILQRKAQNYVAEVEVCERWLNIADLYLSQEFVKKGGGYAFEDTKPHQDLIKRIDKARELLAGTTTTQ
ncbi:HIRAN domain-containing protein [Pseudomonas sp. TMP9]|uniref:HIRAN domain-containing protein n=1 Tax=Pseudomonas sp. TMP9 TaxID=3133144 RepID=UPI0030D56BAD